MSSCYSKHVLKVINFLQLIAGTFSNKKFEQFLQAFRFSRAILALVSHGEKEKCEKFLNLVEIAQKAIVII